MTEIVATAAFDPRCWASLPELPTGSARPARAVRLRRPDRGTGHDDHPATGHRAATDGLAVAARRGPPVDAFHPALDLRRGRRVGAGDRPRRGAPTSGM